MYKDLIPKALELGQEYTEEEIMGYILNNKNVIVLSEHQSHFCKSQTKYKIDNTKETFVHQQALNAYNTYQIPNSKTKVIKISRA